MITRENYDQNKAELKQFLIRQINEAIKDYGNTRRLEIALGHKNSHVEKIMKRGSFSALERLYKEICLDNQDDSDTAKAL